MSIFSGLFRSRDKPENRTAGSSYAFFMGNSTAGKSVTERSDMQMTAVYSCVRILAEAVAGLPLHLYRYRDDGGKEKATDHPLYLLLHDEPNPEMPVLSGMVFCADCGAKLYQVRGRSLPQREYMVCATYRKKGKKVYPSHQTEHINGRKIQRIRIVWNCTGEFTPPVPEPEKSA